ncbi:hypothetical protein CN553_12715 [Bacillus cereus]|uniref:Uncharacterized protein n=1 Tax=Bacillus cereus TaxID=1396 RepID=A0A9X6UCE9_BACCE|nr:hypothetical protein [Bacillus cereus]EOO44221.1 hypothetical protein ICK_06478 [Bacillus cereus BAG1X2-2]EOP00380.1 hypothetical protein ICO_06336 [Bacillus cereus BAG2O-1]PEN97893.1 hypothetical protein CN553_12715 [Bacillus cereus]
MNRLKQLAKELVWMQDELEKESLPEWERENVKKQADDIRMKVVSEGHSVDLFVQYMKEYKNVSVADYKDWINS